MNPNGHAPEVDIDEVSGIPMQWFREVNLACDMFFIRRGMNPNPISFREMMHQEFETRKQRRNRKR
jgi:hypothetical protein